MQTIRFIRNYTESHNPVIKKQNLQFNEECHGMCQRLDELIKSRSLHLHLNQITIWTSIVNITPQKSI